MLTDQAVITLNKKILNGLIGGPIRESKNYRTNEGEAIVGKELLSIVESSNDLIKYIKVVPTEQPLGIYPYVNLVNASLSEHEKIIETETIPEIDVRDIPYQIKTYRGRLPISQELVEDIVDSGVNYGKELGAMAKQLDINTKNNEIINAMKKAPAKSIEGDKALAELINQDIPSAFNVKLFLSSTMYSELDEDDKIDHTGDIPRFKGKEVVKIDDDLIGAGKGFVGDLKHYGHLFDRQFITLKNTNDTEFAKTVEAIVRFDVVVANDSAGYYVTYTG